jgi:hypothetical protein
LPLAFTEHGAIMAASVLNSDRAVEMSVYVVRAFVQLRAVLLDHKVLAEKLAALERRVSHHDNSLAEVIDAIRALMAQPKPVNRPIGFTADLSARDKLAELGPTLNKDDDLLIERRQSRSRRDPFEDMEE